TRDWAQVLPPEEVERREEDDEFDTDDYVAEPTFTSEVPVLTDPYEETEASTWTTSRSRAPCPPAPAARRPICPRAAGRSRADPVPSLAVRHAEGPTPAQAVRRDRKSVV